MHPSIRPYGEDHAIKLMAFAVEFSQPLQPHIFHKILRLHQNLKDELPRKSEHRAVTVNLDPILQGGSSLRGSPDLGGVTFDIVAPTGEQVWALSARPEYLAVSCTEYTRWADALQKAERFIREVLPVILEEHTVSAIGLQYNDEFVWDSKEVFNAEYLFDASSKFLVKNVFEVNDLWHSHHGYFVNLDDPAPHRQLNHVNVDYVETEEGRRIRIATSHKALLENPEGDVNVLLRPDSGAGLIPEYMGVMHEANKDILKDMLVNEMAMRIGLIGEPS
jgi:uncharacterized protein (TIGR04255 family)